MTTSANWVVEAQRRTRLETAPVVARLAVLGSFDPRRIDDAATVEVLRFCAMRLHRDDAEPEWMLHESVRIQALTHQLRLGGMRALKALRLAGVPHFRNALQTMLDAWLLEGQWSPLTMYSDDELAACAHVARWARSSIALAGLPLSSYAGPSPEDIDGRMAVLEVTRPVRRLVRQPVVGRGRELAALRAYLAEPSRGPLSEDPAFCIHGIGGVGKSTLVAAFVTEVAARTERSPWAYLDFDRRTLQPEEQFTIIADLYRQIGAQYPELSKLTDRARAELLEREAGRGLESFDSGGSFREAIVQLALMLTTDVPAPLVVVLDTCEEVQRDPETMDRIHELFDALAAAHGRLKLIVAGRGRVPQFESTLRPDRSMVLGGFDPPDAIAFLHAQIDEARGGAAPLDPGLAADVVKLVGGNPLCLALAARVLIHEGLTAIASAVERAVALGRVRDEFVRGFLYRRVLDHLKGLGDAAQQACLRSVARASLALRYVTAELIERVLKPVLHAPATVGAAALYRDLVAEIGFVEDVGDALRLREDVRGPALDALRIEDAALVERVHRAAREFYDAHPDAPYARVEQRYHALALGDVSGLAVLDRETLNELTRSAADYPEAAASLVQRLLQGSYNDAQLARDDEQRSWELGVLSRADAALRSGDTAAARQLLFERAERSPTTELHRLESRLLEADGNLVAAADAADRDLAAARRATGSERLAAAAVRHAGLLERLDAPGDALDVLADAERSPLLTGHGPLLLELLLHRMNTAERAQLWSKADRWQPGLEVRRQIKLLGNQVEASPTLVRLLAAALGHDEPAYLRRALQHVGLGAEANPRLIDDLARELVRWNAATSGALAGVAGLVLPPTSKSWRDLISVLGAEAGDALSRLWNAESPPSAVREAMRAFYLWWAIPFVPGATPLEAHFLDDVPLVFTRKDTTEFEKLIQSAYPTPEDQRNLCRNIGLDTEGIDFSGRARLILRGVLNQSAERDLLSQLVQRAILTLPSSLSARLRALVGEPWLARNQRHTVLFVNATTDTPPLDVERELGAVDRGLDLAGLRERFELVARFVAGSLDMLRELRELRPAIVHFRARGVPSGLPFAAPDGGPQLVTSAAFGGAFASVGTPVRIVVLSGCYHEDEADGLLPYVECVVGTPASLGDLAIESFATSFYRGLGDGESVLYAYRRARNTLAIFGLDDSMLPRLKTRDGGDAAQLVLAKRPILAGGGGDG